MERVGHLGVSWNQPACQVGTQTVMGMQNFIMETCEVIEKWKMEDTKADILFY